MRLVIKTIGLPLPFRLGIVNCYLIDTKSGFILIDTGASNSRADLESELESAGCTPGELKLIIITHGDFDHTGNAAYLRKTFGAKIGMHPHDAGMAEHGDMFWNRKSGNFLIRTLAGPLFGFGKSKRFRPNIHIEDGCDLSEYGFDAEVISIPGHSKGSIGILTSGGDLFCGDLLENTKEPGLNSIMDDTEAADVSIEKLKGLKIKTIYPGHGEPFPMELIVKDQNQNNPGGRSQ
jgi:glyoxylase-like metal-dependent hydrolase (beta-lactamase superfamily II)